MEINLRLVDVLNLVAGISFLTVFFSAVWYLKAKANRDG